MKYTININQKAIVDLGLQKELDFIDLAIYDFITEFMLCDECRKLNIDNVQYFWIKSDLIIENLPLLGITTTRGISKRIDKLIDCGLLERCNDNQNLHQSFFKVGKNYQAYKFFTWNENSKGAWNENSKNNNKIDNNKKEKDISFSKSDNELFEKCWLAYDRKGQKKEALKCWKKLSDDDKEKIVKHIPFYVKSNERQYLKDFERYIKHRVFESVVTDKRTGNILYDPDRESGAIGYTPILGGALQWNEPNQCYIHIGMYYGYISDGYTDDNRPNGAKVMLGNGQGTVVWSSETKTWNKI